MNNDFLIPANSKRSMLIFGLFTPLDLILFLSGMVVTIILLLTLPLENITITVIALAPGLICGFLVLPIPNYHNIRTILKSIWTFYTTRQKYIWKGWCFFDGEESNEEQIYEQRYTR